jgi:ankyrin repeat protein
MFKNNSFQYGDTPLHTASRYGHAGVARILLSAQANPNLQNKVRKTILSTLFLKHDKNILDFINV